MKFWVRQFGVLCGLKNLKTIQISDRETRKRNRFLDIRDRRLDLKLEEPQTFANTVSFDQNLITSSMQKRVPATNKKDPIR
jgi:hypothetical protein